MTNQSPCAESMERFGNVVHVVVTVSAVVFVFAVLVALFVPAVSKVGEAAARTQMINNLKQTCLAVCNAGDTWKKLPPASGPYGQVKKDYSLSVHLLAFVESNPWYQDAVNGQPMPTTLLLPYYNSPLDQSTADWVRVQNFACNLRVFTDAGFKAYDPKTGYANIDETTISPANTGTFEDRFPDGTSNTIMLSTRYAARGTSLSVNGVCATPCSYYDILAGSAQAGEGAYFGGIVATGFPDATAQTKGGWQVHPPMSDANCDPGLKGKGPGSLAMSFGHSGLFVAMADGSIHPLASTTSAATWNAALQPNDAKPLGSDW